MVSLKDFTIEHFNETFAVNTIGPILITQSFLPFFPRGSSIIFASSVATRLAGPLGHVYGGSKIVLEYLTKSWTSEWGIDRGVNINNIVIGPVNTDMKDEIFKGLADTPEYMQYVPKLKAAFESQEEASPEDIANIVVMLSSEKARWITGSSISGTRGGSVFIG